MASLRTEGFRASVMPQIGLADPRLVAFNPGAVTTGMAQAFDLAQMLEQIKSSKALQAEAAATREARIAQQNALAELAIQKAGAEGRLLPKEEFVRGLKFDTEAQILPQKTKLDLAGITETLKTLPLSEEAKRQVAASTIKREEEIRPKIPELISSEVDIARAKGAQARSDIELAPAKEAAAQAQLSLAAQIARLQSIGAPAEYLLKATKIAQELGDAKDIREYNEKLRKAELALKESQTFENLAQGQYALSGRQAKSPEAQKRELQALILQTRSLPLPDGRTLEAYLKETYNSDGSLKRNAPFFTKSERDPVGDMFRDILNSYYKDLDMLTSGGKATNPSLPQNSSKGGAKVRVKDPKTGEWVYKK